jgi:hypothetical protein
MKNDDGGDVSFGQQGDFTQKYKEFKAAVKARGA